MKIRRTAPFPATSTTTIGALAPMFLVLSIMLSSCHCFSPNAKSTMPYVSFITTKSRAMMTNTNINTSQEDSSSSSSSENKNKKKIITDSILTTPSSVLDENLTSNEKSIVGVVRSRGSSVVCVSSYNVPRARDTNNRRMGRGKRNNINAMKENDSTQPKQQPPRGSRSLGSGSGFFISSNGYDYGGGNGNGNESAGYLLTNYHVIERAYRLQQSEEQLEEWVQNVTQAVTKFSVLPNIPPRDSDSKQSKKPYQTPYYPQVYVRLASSKDLWPCRIVHVKPESDLAILQIVQDPTSSSSDTSPSTGMESIPPPIPTGTSTNLLVGQTVLAIGNPFGLDQTVTSGVVSALDRSVRGIAGNDIRGCIQTDASINPGNSGGPLLNLDGEVIGVNTMIVSTSGSNAGIGFAVPLETIWDDILVVLEEDQLKQQEEKENESSSSSSDGKTRRRKGWLGLNVLVNDTLEQILWKRLEAERIGAGTGSSESDSSSSLKHGKKKGVYVTQIEQDSPAQEVGIEPLIMKDGMVQIGDIIVNVNGNTIDSKGDLRKELSSRVVGEQINLTLENDKGERRVVYLTLGDKMMAKEMKNKEETKNVKV